MKEVAEKIKEAKFAIALTGAGISTESGIPDFRSKNGLWSRYDINEYGYIENFMANPAKVWKMLAEMLLTFKDVEPNPAHYALAELEKEGILKAVITQNIDNLHQKAGSKNVIEFHGNFNRLTCMKCGAKYGIDEINLEELPPKCKCEGIIKPDIIFFGEAIPRDALVKAFDMANRCDLMLVIGTSCVVYPAAELPLIAKRKGATIIEINREDTMISHIADYKLRGKAGEIMSKLLEEIKNPP
ncbi:MAG TPA: NAD-dependent deacylase [Thermoplasmatales archaeon]|nr:NAD-dependent deacylase [Thermoplasmatales archaeon]